MKNLPNEFATQIAALVCHGYYVKPIGSRVTSSGYSPRSDFDFVVYDPEKTLCHSLHKNFSFSEDGSGNSNSEFLSYRYRSTSFAEPSLNLICVFDKETFNKYVAATELIKVMDCKTKEERIKVFDTIFGKSEKVLPF